MAPKFARLILTFIACSLVTACQRYSVSLNQKPIYTPPGLFKNFHIPDVALQDCVEQTIIDLHVTKVEELTRLNCSDANIASLKGLGKFYALRDLNLDNNNLQEIDELAQLGRLELLHIAQNKIKNAAPLLNLLHLKKLVINDNDRLECEDLQQLIHNQEANFEITLPKHCDNAQKS